MYYNYEKNWDRKYKSVTLLLKMKVTIDVSQGNEAKKEKSAPRIGCTTEFHRQDAYTVLLILKS